VNTNHTLIASFSAHIPFSGKNFWVFSLEETRDVRVAKSKHPKLAISEIILEDFQPMWSQYLNVMHKQRDDLL